MYEHIKTTSTIWTALMFAVLFGTVSLLAQEKDGAEGKKSEEVGKLSLNSWGPQLPTPNTYRNAAGAPGVDYWQQRADYRISVVLDDVQQQISGEEEITYYNKFARPT